MINHKQPFWMEKTLEELTPQEWEALCDGCGKCCLHKLTDPDSGHVYYTNVICRFIDLTTCLCSDYSNRYTLTKDCVHMTPKLVQEANWLPKSCAYRRIALGQGLAWWHPLVSGDPRSVGMAGISILDKVVKDDEVDQDDLEDMVVTWFD